MSSLFVITGGPGSGKSTLIAALREAGFATAEEAGRAVIREEVAAGGDALPWENRLAFAEKMLVRDVASYEEHAAAAQPVFFDRGIPDVLGYLQLCGLPVPYHMREIAERRRYNPLVFIAPFWPEIYAQDEERRQDADEAMRTFATMDQVYREFGYDLWELPLSNVEQRVRFVMDAAGL